MLLSIYYKLSLSNGDGGVMGITYTDRVMQIFLESSTEHSHMYM